MSMDELLRQLLGDDPQTVAPTFRQWLSASRRFRTFAEQYQTKIRAKLRSAGDEEALQDLLFELEIARWLLQEKRFHLAYESQGLRTGPGPDFTVSFTTKTTFHVEVTRIRPQANGDGVAVEANTSKLLYVIVGKLSQIKAGAANLLLIGLEPASVTTSEVGDLIKQMKLRMATSEPLLLTRSRLNTAGEFFKQYHALSGILLYFSTQPAVTASSTPAPLLWLNKEAKYPLLTQVQTSLRQLPPNE